MYHCDLAVMGAARLCVCVCLCAGVCVKVYSNLNDVPKCDRILLVGLSLLASAKPAAIFLFPRKHVWSSGSSAGAVSTQHLDLTLSRFPGCEGQEGLRGDSFV